MAPLLKHSPCAAAAAISASVICLATIGVATLSRASDVDAPRDEVAAEDQPDETPQRVIVLTTGRVVLGDVVERPGGYLVREQFGSVVVPFTHVRLTAASLPDAYDKLRSSLREPTAGKHLELAEWCFDNRLYSSAQMEIKQCLMLEPERKDARLLLRKVRRTLETGVHTDDLTSTGGIQMTSTGGAFPGQAWKAYARRREQLRQEESVSVAGLSPEAVHVFVTEVQPLLVNKCGNARCHGESAENGFRLTQVRQGMSGFRTLTNQNLSSVLEQIDNGNPGNSALLNAVQGRHGGSRRPLLVGRYAEGQLASLRQWVMQAAADSNLRGNPEIVQVAATTAPVPPPTEEKSEAAPEPDRKSPPLDPFLEQILDEERQDRFDPEVFNRLMHDRR